MHFISQPNCLHLQPKQNFFVFSVVFCIQLCLLILSRSYRIALYKCVCIVDENVIIFDSALCLLLCRWLAGKLRHIYTIMRKNIYNHTTLWKQSHNKNDYRKMPFILINANIYYKLFCSFFLYFFFQFLLVCFRIIHEYEDNLAFSRSYSHVAPNISKTKCKKEKTVSNYKKCGYNDAQIVAQSTQDK